MAGKEFKIILTGFEPFGGAAVNPSWEGVKLVPERIIAGSSSAEVVKVRLPVVYGRAYEVLKAEMADEKPDAVICTGLASGRKSVTPEVIAVNLMHASSADNSGFRPSWEKIDPAGPDGLFSTLPNLEMVSAVNSLGISSSLSFSAGTYVCNDLFYRLMRGNISCGFYKSFPAGFIHVPDIAPEQIASALTACIKTVLTLRN
ncbi:MAG: pyroglutamyl-peptidase I [Clostridia bacterium]|nr:pyroglutamyl-peptidase I [Clostridia bacterium]